MSGPSQLPRRLLLLAVTAALAVIVVYFVAVGTRWGQSLDERALLGRDVISNLRTAQADRFLRIVSGGTLAIATALVAGVAFLRGRPRMALIAAGSIGLAGLCTEFLKVFLLNRPDLVATSLNNGENSYPSGHTTVGMSVCIAALLVVPPRLRVPTALASGGIGAAFGIAVVAAGWHRPSDAIGAYLVCLAVGAAAAVAIRLWPDPEESEKRRTAGFVRGGIGATELGLAALGLALAAVFGIAALSARGVPLFSAGTGFLAASGALVVASFACAAALAATMSAEDRT